MPGSNDWLKDARKHLVETCGDQLGQVVLIVYYRLSGEGVEYTLPPNEGGRPAVRFTTAEAAAPPVGQRVGEPHLRRVHRRILEVATLTPLLAKQLAVRAGYRKCNSYVRMALTDLVRWGRLRHGPDGYFLPPS